MLCSLDTGRPNRSSEHAVVASLDRLQQSVSVTAVVAAGTLHRQSHGQHHHAMTSTEICCGNSNCRIREGAKSICTGIIICLNSRRSQVTANHCLVLLV